MQKSVLILGASGRFGRHAKSAFEARGWRTRIFVRGEDSLDEAAKNVNVIVNGWNPPYPQWAKSVPSLHAQVRRVARDNAATVILPGNVYVFGAEAGRPWSETTPHNATTALGRIRADMEAAYKQDGVRTIVLRAGDFLDTEASGNWFDQVLAKSIKSGRFVYPGDPDATHAWAYLPDLCRAAVDLAERRFELPLFADIPFGGFTLTGREMAEMLAWETGAGVELRAFPWWRLSLARPFWPMAKHLIEMRYLWDTPHQLDNAAFRRILPGFAPTPAPQALRAAIAPLMGDVGAAQVALA